MAAMPVPSAGALEVEEVGEAIALSEKTYQGTTTRKMARLVKFNGKGPYLDLRVYTTSPTYSGPTKKGLTLTALELEHLVVLAPELLARMEGARAS